MKKVALFLAVTCLFTGITLAQAPQVRKVWEIVLPDAVNDVAIDTLNGQPIVVVDELSRVVVLGPQGEELRSFAGRSLQYDRCRRISKNGRFVAIRSNFWGNRGNSLPSLRGALKDIYTIGVSNDGGRRLGLKIIGTGDVENYVGDTLVFFDQDGNAVADVPTPGLELAKFSPKGDVLFARYKHYKPGQPISEHRFPLAAYDRNGRLLWLEDKKRHMFVFDADTLNNLCNLEWDQTAGWSLAFYGINGREQKRVPILPQEERFNVNASDLEVSLDGRYALLGADRQGLFFVDKNAGRVLWTYKQTTGEGVWDIALSEDGQYALATIVDMPREDPKTSNVPWGHAYLFDRSGKIVWSSEPRRAVGRAWMGKGYFAYGGQGLKLYQIIP